MGILSRCAWGMMLRVNRQPTLGSQQQVSRIDSWSVRGFRKLRLESGGNGRKQSSLSPLDMVEPGGPVSPDTVWRATVFAGSMCVSCFVGSVIWQYEASRRKRAMTASREQGRYELQRPKAGELRRRMNALWSRLSPGEKAFVPICVANVLVWCAWRVPSLRPVMLRYFTASPSSPSVVPMLLSAFSHYSFLHLFVNMYVLRSFSNSAVSSMGREQFYGFYLSAGVVSSWTSHMYKIFTGIAGMSLGASGAIMGVVGYVCTMHPDVRLAIIFLPQWTFSADQAIKAVLMFDTCGAVMKWTVFDHAAHLGGTMFGIVYAYFGPQLASRRERLMSSWHSFRTGFDGRASRED